MPVRYQVRFSLRAASDLERIFKYIREISPQNAKRMIRKLVRAIDSLAVLPHRHKVVEERSDIAEEVRSMVERPYVIRYHVDDRNRAVIVHSVRHGARRS